MDPPSSSGPVRGKESSPQGPLQLSDESADTQAMSVSLESAVSDITPGRFDNRLDQTTFYFVTEPNDPFVQSWEIPLRPGSLDLIGARNDWTALGVRNIGFNTADPKQHKRIVRITYTTTLGPDWTDLLRSIHNLVVRAGWPAVGVHTQRAAPIRTGRDYLDNLPINSPIAAGVGNTGYIGLWVEVQTGKGETGFEKMGLTCHHVLLHSKHASGTDRICPAKSVDSSY